MLCLGRIEELESQLESQNGTIWDLQHKLEQQAAAQERQNAALEAGKTGLR